MLEWHQCRRCGSPVGTPGGTCACCTYEPNDQACEKQRLPPTRVVDTPRPLEVTQDDLSDTITIEGTRYSRHLFRELGHAWPGMVGKAWTVVRRQPEGTMLLHALGPVCDVVAAECAAKADGHG